MIAAPPPKPRRPAPARGPSAPIRALTLAASFRYAFAGLRYLLRSQRNARIHVGLALAVTMLGLLINISRVEWLALTLAITMVIVTEGMNTAIEAAVDLAAPDYHPLAKIAKDVAAGMVLITAFASVVVGLIVFLPHLLSLTAELLASAP